MSENPLLPHSKLRELHTLMLRCRSLERARKTRGAAREALLAATSIQLLPGDLVSAPKGDGTVQHLAPEAKSRAAGGSIAAGGLVETVSADARLLMSAAAARGLQAAGSDGLVLAYCKAGGNEPGWKQALEWAQGAQLPLLVACADATGGAASRAGKRQEPLTYAAMVRFARRLKLPVLTVDGEDAVAVYRVMQESVLRARMGGGPAVLWAAMTPAPAMGGAPLSALPVARLRGYMTARKISLKP